MTGKTFRRQVIVTIFVLVVASVVTLYAGLRWPAFIGDKFSDATRSIIPAYVAVAAGWLAFCLQRRVAYTNALRALWEKVVSTVQGAIQYTHLSSPEQKDFASIMPELSCRVDEIRGVFRNVEEQYKEPSETTKNFLETVKQTSLDDLGDVLEIYETYRAKWDHIGLYPFESLKQIQSVVERLGFGGTFTPERAVVTRNTILILWGIFRSELLKELDRDYPEFPDTLYKASRRPLW